MWLKPKFVTLKKHQLPGGKKLTVKTGTQEIDRAWRCIKDHLKHTPAKPGTRDLAVKIRSAQWAYWHSKDDKWIAGGEMLARAFKRRRL